MMVNCVEREFDDIAKSTVGVDGSERDFGLYREIDSGGRWF